MANLATTEISSDNSFTVEQHFLGFQARKFFPNGYGVSIIPETGAFINLNRIVEGRNKSLGNEEYEVGILTHEDNGKEYSLCYDTEITDDVLRYLSYEGVLEIVGKVEKLPPRNRLQESSQKFLPYSDVAPVRVDG